MPFINCISKINSVKIDNAEDLDFVMPMYNLLEYSKNYRKRTGSLWNYYRGEQSDPLLILNLLNIKTMLQEILIMFLKQLLMMKVIKFQILIMMQTKLVKRKLKLLFH